MVSTTPGIVHNVKVLTTVSTEWSVRGMHSPGEVQKLDIEAGSTPLSFCTTKHPRIGFECVDLSHSFRIIVKEVHAGTYADLKDTPLSHGDNALTNLSDRLWVPQHAYKLGIDAVFVERHSCLLSYVPFRRVAITLTSMTSGK
jgi:hypothetical protein